MEYPGCVTEHLLRSCSQGQMWMLREGKKRAGGEEGRKRERQDLN